MDGIADYRFIRSLGPGHYGGCYLARTPERLPVDADNVVVKVIEGTGTEAFRRAVTELKAAAAVPSPHIAALYDAGQQGGNFYYSMEYLPGGSLREPLSPIDRRTALEALSHAALAARALHDAGIVHRDVRPGNVMLADDGGRLADLGLNHLLTPGVAVPGSGGHQSIAFADPALLDGHTAEPAVDIWSLGATLHWVMAGGGLYGDLPTGDPLTALQTVLGTPPLVSDGLEPGVAELIGDCLRRREDRPDAGTVATRLRTLARSA